MMRGSGIAGVCGIAPVRDEIVRPLIEISKKQVLDVMAENELPYVTDNTNSSTDYTRNYIRHEILPLLFRLNDNPERALTRLTSAIREDKEYLDSVAADFLSGRSVNGHIDRAALRELHPSIFSRVLIQMAKGVGCGIEATHISKIKELMDLTSFSYDLPQSCSFVCRNGECYIAPRVQGERVEYTFELKEGINTYPGIRGAIALTKEPLNDSFSNVYKISIQRSFDFDIINGVISARNKKDGDSYSYGGITRKLKKLFNDRSIPPEMRAYIPVICDESGILWVPGFGSREDKSKTSSNKIYISLLSEVENGEIKNENSFRKGTDWTHKS